MNYLRLSKKNAHKYAHWRKQLTKRSKGDHRRWTALAVFEIKFGRRYDPIKDEITIGRYEDVRFFRK